MNRLRFFILLFAALQWGCQEDVVTPVQYGKITGRAVSKTDGSPIRDVELTTSPTSKTVLSGPDGRFDFGQIPVGTYTVKAAHDDYLSDLETTVLEKGDSVFLLFRLVSDTLNNRLPLPAEPVSPSDFSTGQKRTVDLAWRQAEDQDAGEELLYSILLFKNGALKADTVVWKTQDTTAQAKNLDYATAYGWQILVFDKSGTAVFGAVQHFKTEDFPDNRFLFCRKVDGAFQIFSSNQTGSTLVQLTDCPANCWRPRMSPLRDKIAFLSDADLDVQLWTMNRDGSGAKKVTSLSVSGFSKTDLDFSWSPDGSKLLFPHQNRLYRVGADGAGLSLFAEAPAGQTFIEADWNGPAQRILARTTGAQIFNSEILLYDELGALKSKVVADSAGSLSGPMFSIDGKKMLFAYDQAGFDGIDGRQLDSRIFLKTLATGLNSALSAAKTAGTNDLDPRFSPDGAKVIFTNASNDGISPRSVFLMNLDGTGRVKLFDDAEMPDWR